MFLSPNLQNIPWPGLCQGPPSRRRRSRGPAGKRCWPDPPPSFAGPKPNFVGPPPLQGRGPGAWLDGAGWLDPMGGGGRVPSGFRKPLYLALAMDTHRKCGGPTRFFVNIWAISLVSNGVDPQMEGQCVISSLKTWTQTPSSRAGRTMTESG